MKQGQPHPLTEILLQSRVDILEMILECLGEGVIVTDKNGISLLHNPAAREILGMASTACALEQWPTVYGIFKTDMLTPYPAKDLPLFKAIQGYDSNEAILFIRNHRHPQGRFVKATGRPLQDSDGTVQGGVIVFRDVTDAHKIEKQLQRDAYHDPLTGIYNLRYITERLHESFGFAKRHNGPFCIAVCDLDHLKNINDQYGHAQGDVAIQAFAELLDREFRTEDVVSRIGGDEFCMILPRLAINQAVECMERMRLKWAAQDFRIEGESPLRLSCSVGIADYKPEMVNYLQMLKAADKALYQAKEFGRNQIVVCSE